MTTVWTNTLGNEFRRRFYKNWYKSKKKAFTKYTQNWSAEAQATNLAKIKKYCSVVRVIAHTQPQVLNNIDVKKAHIMEIQVNGGTSVAQKVDFATGLFERDVSINDVFAEGQICDVLGATKGHGFTGVIKRWGSKLLPKKTHRGYRKVGCIGSWHPSNVQWTVARAGQAGYHHRTEMDKKIYKIGIWFS